MSNNKVTLHRVLAAAPEKVFRAFSDADAHASWIPPYGFVCQVHQMEFKENGTSTFLQLLGRGYTDSQGFLRWFLTTQYPGVFTNFTEAVHKAYPELSAEEMFWRLHFTMGTIVFTMSSSDALIDIAHNDFDRQVDIAGVIKQVIPYVAAGVAAPIIK